MKTIEEKIYEFIGIKQFKKIAVSLGKHARKNQRISKGDNYFLHKVNTEGIKDFKENGIKVNSIVHIGALPFCIFHIATSASSFFMPIYVLGGLINLYCVILQRYNNIRLNRVYKQLKEREARRSELGKTSTSISLKQELEPNLNVNKTNSKVECLKVIKNNLTHQQSLIENEKENDSHIKKLTYK